MHKPSKKQKWEKKKREAEKRKKLKSEKRKPKLKPWEAPKMKLYQVPNPFAQIGKIPREKRLQIIREIGEKADADFKKKYAEAEKWFDEFDPLYILSFCANYFTGHPEGIDPEVNGRMDFPPHLLEILQAIALTRDRTFSVTPLVDKALDLQKGMRALGDLMVERLSKIPAGITAEKDVSAFMVRTEVMSHTMVIRNWAYYHQMVKATTDLATLVDTQFEKVYGAQASRFITILFTLLEQRNDLLNAHWERLRPLAKAQGHREIMRAYNAAFPDTARISEEEMDRLWEMTGKVRENLIGMMVSHADLRLQFIYSFSFADVKALSHDEAEAEALWKIFESLTYQFGDLRDSNKEHFILQNPVARKPFIDTGDRTLFTTMWRVLPHNALDILEELVWPHPEVQAKYVEAKAKYLEDEVSRIFRKAFPSAKIHAGSLWSPAPGTVYENDLTVVIDSFALVVEAKSGTVTDRARRGAPERLFKTFKDLVEEPSDQAMRFIKLLSENKTEHSFTTKRGALNKIDSTNIKYYIPLGVTFSHLGQVGSNLKKLIDAKIVDRPLEELAPSMNYTDIEIVFDILDSEAERIHYLGRRREFEAHVLYQGDELDLFAFYLDHGFNIGEEEYSRTAEFHLGMKAKELDPYVIGTSEGRTIEKPRLQMTKYWRDLLDTIQSRKPEGWLETCYILLNLQKEQQEKLIEKFEELKETVRQGKAPFDHNSIIYFTDPERRRYVVAGYPYSTKDKDYRNEGMDHILDDETAAKARGIAVIGIDVNKSDYPYSVMARRMSTDLFDTLTLQSNGEGNDDVDTIEDLS